MNEATLRKLTEALWPDGDTLGGAQVHWLLDGARDPEISRLVRFGGLEYTCLFSGRLHPRLEAAAPYLVHLAAGSPTTNRLLRQGWGKAWGILTVAPADVTLVQQRLHLKKLLRVQTEEGAVLAFRYYDPRVLNVYLPTCTEQERHTVFGPLHALVAETGGGAALRLFRSEQAGGGSCDVALTDGPAPGRADGAAPGLSGLVEGEDSVHRTQASVAGQVDGDTLAARSTTISPT